MRLELTLHVKPLVHSIDVKFVVKPKALVDVNITGIRGNAIESLNFQRLKASKNFNLPMVSFAAVYLTIMCQRTSATNMKVKNIIRSCSRHQRIEWLVCKNRLQNRRCSILPSRTQHSASMNCLRRHRILCCRSANQRLSKN